MQVIHDAITTIRNSTMPTARIDNNVRVIRSFERSRQPRRQLNTGQTQTMTSTLSGVELRFTPDLSATEGQQQKHLLYNSRQAPITPEVAKTTLEIVHWLLLRNGINVGSVVVVKVGISGTQNNNLIWVGNATSFASKMANLAAEPFNVYITQAVYDELSEDRRMAEGKNMWEYHHVTVGGDTTKVIRTNYHWSTG
jgi:hypothetical protein